jgi:anti-anti-sigma factor
MSITTFTSGDGHTLTIRVQDRFDFKVHRELREAYEAGGKRYGSYVLDLRGTSYMDSAALGMLLQLREHAGGRKQSVCLSNAQPVIRNILAVANFDQLFTID